MNINEIAKMAGVSRATVSRYLNNGYVSEEKKKVISKVIEETGYQPSSQAQMLRTKKTKLVGVILPKIDSNTISREVAGISDILTQKGYQMRSQHALTGAMEDYLEMICRQAEADGCARIGLLAEGLNVRPSSASKMVYQLRALGLVAFEKYGLIQPTEKGWSVGRWLLHRHEVLHRFFCMLNGSTDELELVEQVEHYLNEGTVRNLEGLLERLEHGEG